MVEMTFWTKFGKVNGGFALVARQNFLDLLINFMKLDEFVVL